MLDLESEKKNSYIININNRNNFLCNIHDVNIFTFSWNILIDSKTNAKVELQK